MTSRTVPPRNAEATLGASYLTRQQSQYGDWTPRVLHPTRVLIPSPGPYPTPSCPTPPPRLTPVFWPYFHFDLEDATGVELLHLISDLVLHERLRVEPEWMLWIIQVKLW